MTGTRIPESLKLVLDHLNAVREIDRYLNKKGMGKDLQRYAKDVLRPALESRLPFRGPWKCEIEVDTGASVEWYPETWKLAGDLYVSLCVILPSPTDTDADSDPSINLWVPTDWPGHDAFIDPSTKCIQTLMDDGFEHISKHDDWVDECALGAYANWLDSDGTFDESHLIERIAAEAEKIVRMEPEITQAIRRVSSISGKKQSAGGSRGTKSRSR